MRRAGAWVLVGWSAVVSASVASAADAPKVVGDWKGTLKVAPGVELGLIFHVVEKEGALTSTMDSPDQGKAAMGIKVDGTTFKDGVLDLDLKRLSATFKGKIDAKGDAIGGEWSQAGRTWPLTLERFDPAKVKTTDVPKELEGYWEGKIAAGAGLELRIGLKVTKGKDGKLVAVLRSPDQTDQDLPVSSVTLEGKTVTVVAKALGATFTGDFDAAKTIVEGKWKQGGAALPLKLKKLEKETQAKRPQTPKGPFPYESVEVSYDNPASKFKLAGTLTKPKGEGPFPVAIMISGSGQQDRDENLFQHKPFLVIADALARRGVAVLRVDDRGVGGSTGSAETATSEDFAGDVLAGIRYLKTRKDVDAKRIGLIGHSEGGLIGPMVAAKNPEEVAFVVLLAGPGLDGATILKLQSHLILKAMGASKEDLEQQKEMMGKLLEIAITEPDEAKAKTKLLAAARAAVEKLSKEKRKEYEATQAAAEGRVALFATPWFRYFLKHDPAPTLAKVKCPVLAVNGEKDLQVPAKENLDAIAKALTSGGNSTFVAKALPDLNHLFQTCKTGSPSEYAALEETFAPSALEFVCDWVVATTGAK